MTATDEKRLWLALRLAPEMNRSRFYALLEHFGTPMAVFGASARQIAGVRGFDSDLARAVLEAPRKAPVARELDLMASAGVRLLTAADPDYPANFRLSFSPPPMVYVRGTLHPNDRYAVALVGSRNSTAYGRGVSQQFASRFAACGITVVSGFARGVDAAAHQGALAAGGRTIAVLGSGLGVCYPAEHHALGERIAAGRGALISEYPMQTPPERYNFPERNRLIALLAFGTIVVEAAERSGALITAREALEENRFVFAVPGDVTRLNSRGSNALIQSGARLAQRADDVLFELKDLLQGYLNEEAFRAASEPAVSPRARRPAGDSAPAPHLREMPEETPTATVPAAPASPAATASSPPPDLTPDEALIYELIRHEPQYLDSLAAQVDPERLPVPRLSALLLSLELKQVIRQLPGRLYAVLE